MEVSSWIVRSVVRALLADVVCAMNQTRVEMRSRIAMK
jgi:hypothetical protein